MAAGLSRRDGSGRAVDAVASGSFVVPAAAATSAAKSLSCFSMPSPSRKQTNSVTVIGAAGVGLGGLQRLLDGLLGIDHEGLRSSTTSS